MLRYQSLGQNEIKIVGTHENLEDEGRKARIVVDGGWRFMDNSRPSLAGVVRLVNVDARLIMSLSGDVSFWRQVGAG